jgi:hypothetical protein
MVIGIDQIALAFMQEEMLTLLEDYSVRLLWNKVTLYMLGQIAFFESVKNLAAEAYT